MSIEMDTEDASLLLLVDEMSAKGYEIKTQVEARLTAAGHDVSQGEWSVALNSRAHFVISGERMCTVVCDWPHLRVEWP
jgi:hypothetical protein